MADYHSKRPYVKTPMVENGIIDKIEDKTSSLENNLEDDLEKIESFIPGHHESTEEKSEDSSSTFDFDLDSEMQTIGNLGRGERGEPQHHFLGFTEYDLIDYMEGFATGIYHKDVKEEYDMCVLGVPRYAYEIYNISQSISFSNLFTLSGFEQNFKEVEESITLIMTMVEEGPKELAACEQLWDDGANTINWIMHHLSPT